MTLARGILETRFSAGVMPAGDGLILKGLAVPYGKPAQLPGFSEQFAPHSLRAACEGQDILALQDHDMGKLLGRTRSGTLALHDQPDGLHFTLSLPDTERGREVYALAKRGDLGGVSVGFSDPADEWQGRETRIIHSARLHEISIISGHPAYGETFVEPRSRPVVDSADLVTVRAREIEILRLQCDFS